MRKYEKLVNANTCNTLDPFTIFCESLEQSLHNQLKGQIGVHYATETDTIKVAIKRGIMLFRYDIEHASAHVLSTGANECGLKIVKLYKKVLYTRISGIYFNENTDNA